jgi:YD repeat-containing protein
VVMHVMKHLVRTLLSLTLAPALCLACRVSEPASDSAGVLVSDPDGCRSFASLGGVSLGESPGEQRCRFDPVAAEHRCDIDVSGELVSSVTQYASLADFVEAGRALGKVTSLAETRVEDGEPRRIAHRYDELGRLVRRLDEGRSTTTRTTFADHDAHGRPRQATEESSGQRTPCVVRVDIEYRDAERTVLRHSRPAEPERCGFSQQTVIERYDAAGNRVSIEAADGAGVERRFATHRTAATERVCL